MGENATGGAVFVTSQDPVINGGHTGYIQAQAGNYSDFGAQGAINLPVGDKFAARVAFNAREARQLLRHHRSLHRRRWREDRQRPARHAVGADAIVSRSTSRRTTTTWICRVIRRIRSSPPTISFDITANADYPRARPLRPRGAQGRLRVRATAPRCARSRATRRARPNIAPTWTAPGAGNATGSSATSRNEDDLLGGDQPHLLGRQQAQVDPRRLLPARRAATSARTAGSTSAFRRRSSICSTAPTPREHGGLRPGQLRHAGRVSSCSSARATPTTAPPTTSTSTSTACRSRSSRRQTFTNTSGKVTLNWTVERAQLPVCLRRHRLPAGRPQRAGGSRRAARRSTKRRSRTTRSAGRRAGPTASCARSSTPTTTTTRISR